jgi:two-component system NtrC family sensor kinase
MSLLHVENANFSEEELFSGINTSLAYAIGVFEINGGIVYANAGMKRILSTKNGEESLDNLINPSWNHLSENANGNTILYDGIFTFNVGSKSYESLKGIAQRNAEQILLIAEYDVAEMSKVQIELVGLNSEVTNLQRELAIKNNQLEKTLSKLKETQMMLIHSEKMNAMGQLVAGVAHEINNPISFVTSNVHSLGEMTKDLVKAFSKLEQEVDAAQLESLTRTVAQIHKEADIDFIVTDLDDLLATSLDGLKRVKKIVAELRNFSRLDEAESKRASLREGIESSLSLAQSELKNRILVELDIDPDLPEIICRPAELNQVFLNIIINAAQAIQGAGHLRIKATYDSEFIFLEFSDDGMGMTSEVQKNIFNPFFTTKAVGSGTGLGLSIAHKIITDGHRGTISVESRLGLGTSFVIKLPIDK